MKSLVLLIVMTALVAGGCKKKQPQPAPLDNTPTPPAPATPSANTGPSPSSNNNTVGVVPTAGAGGGVVTNPGLGGGGSGGAAQAVRKAARRPVTGNDLKQIQLYIDTASSASGQMPSVRETYTAIKQEAPKIAEAIDDGSLVLNPAKTREEVWAYEAVALESSGWVLTSSGAERMDAQTLKTRLGLR